MKFPSKITVASLDVMPFINFTKDGKAKGSEGHLIGILSQALGFDYHIKAPPEKVWGNRAPNGTWTGLVKMVLTGEADFAMCNIGYTEERYTAIDFSFPYTYINLVFATNLPKPLLKEKIFMYAFDFMTWISLFLLLLLLPFVFHLMMGPKSSYIDQLLTVFGNLLHQPTSNEVFVGRFMMACWWFMSLILSTSFSAGLSSIMMVPFTEPTLQNFRELAVALESGSYQAYILEGTATITMLYHTDQSHFIKIAEYIEKNNWFATNEEFSKAKEFKPKTAMLGVTVMLHNWYGEPPLSTKYIAKDESITTRIGIVFSKNFCCKKQLNDALLKILGGGIYKKLLSDEFFKSWLKAPKKDFKKSHDGPLTLNDVSGAFALLLCGSVISLIVFLCELVSMRLRK